jgi:DNA-binding IclR family transcriptional regulator
VSVPTQRPGTASSDLRARQPQAVHSALTVLEEVARCGPGVTAQQVSTNLSMPRATTYRLINLLVQDEYLVRMPDLQGFTLGRKVIELAHLVEPDPAGAEVAHPVPAWNIMTPAARAVVSDLRRGIRGGIHLVGYLGNAMFVADADPDFPLTDERRLLSDHGASALGRLLLAERSVGRPASSRESVPVDAVTHDRGGMRGVDTEGWARQVGSFSQGFGCLALPVRRADGELIGGLALSAPRVRIEAPGALLEQLAATAHRLAPLLSSPGA